MTLSKSWFDNAIKIYTESRNNTFDSIKLARFNGILEGLNLAYSELVKPPVKGEVKKHEPNIEKGYDAILKYYIAQGKTPEEANAIAMKVMDQQQLRIT